MASMDGNMRDECMLEFNKRRRSTHIIVIQKKQALDKPADLAGEGICII